MTTLAISHNNPFDDLSRRAYFEFIDVLDYVWKSPKLIEQETKIEVAKSSAYFPNEPELKRMRAQLEFPKLQETFPYLVAVGNLFSVMSLFESYLLLLAAEIQELSQSLVRETKGQGASKLFNYLKSAKLSPAAIPLYEQIQGATLVRNCFMHSSGMLSWSRGEIELRRLQASGSYLSPEHRLMRREKKGNFDELSIQASPLGDRLILKNQYSWLVCGYLRDYFVALCDDAGRVFSVKNQ